MRFTVLAPVLLLAIAASASPTAPFPTCDALEGTLNEFISDISNIEDSLETIEQVAIVLDPLGAAACKVKEEICKLSDHLDTIERVGSILKFVPEIGPAMGAMGNAAKAANLEAKPLCAEAKVICNTMNAGASSMAHMYIQAWPHIKESLDATTHACQAALGAITVAETSVAPFCGGNDVDSSCAAVLSDIESAEADAQNLKEQLEQLISQPFQATIQQLLGVLHAIDSSLEGVMAPLANIDDIFTALDALNLPNMPSCTPAVPEVCTPGVPKKCATVKYPCGMKTKCCHKIARRCVCRKPVTKWCSHQECTPAVPEVCTPAVPEFCPMKVAIDQLFNAMGIVGIPPLPDLNFLDVSLPSLPDFGFYTVDLSFDIPNLVEELEIDLPALSGISFDVPDVDFSFPSCLAA